MLGAVLSKQERRLNGPIGLDSETHFKIMNREDMKNAYRSN